MPALIHTLVISSAVLLAYGWLKIPWLQAYYFPLFLAMLVVYLAIKRLRQAKIWHLAPKINSAEMALVTLMFLFLIGATNNTRSVFFFLTYLHLFFLAMSAEIKTAVIITLEIMIFHFLLEPQITQSDISNLITIPIVMVFFLFAKQQHQEIVKERLVIDQEEKELKTLVAEDQNLQSFLMSFLQPKLELLQQLLGHPVQNKQAALGQLNLIMINLEKIQQRLKNHSDHNEETQR